MINRTELMVQILQSEKAQEIVDEISQIYGNSYVGLWLIQAIGTVLDDLWAIVESLPAEFIPTTATWALEYWEQEYGFAKDSTLTTEQRQQRFVTKLMDKIPYNPARMEAIVAGVLGIPAEMVEIKENVSKNKFVVYIRRYVDDLSAAVQIINKKKPSHLIYDIVVAEKVESEVNVEVALALNVYEKFEVEVL